MTREAALHEIAHLKGHCPRCDAQRDATGGPITHAQNCPIKLALEQPTQVGLGLAREDGPYR